MSGLILLLALAILINSAAYELPVKEVQSSFPPDSSWTSCDYFDLPGRINVGSVSYDIATGDVSFSDVDVGFFKLIRKVAISAVKKVPNGQPKVLKKSKAYITPGTSKFPLKSEPFENVDGANHIQIKIIGNRVRSGSKSANGDKAHPYHECLQRPLAPLNQNCDVNVVIPDGVTVIPNETFKGCSNMKSIQMSDSVVAIGYSAFEDCASLEKAIIGNSTASNLTTIGKFAFKNCHNLVDLQISSVVLDEIGVGVIENCTSLLSPPDHPSESDYWNYVNPKSDRGVMGTIIPAYVTSIPERAFEYRPGSWIIMGDQVVTIGGNAFYNSPVKTVNIGSGLETIGDFAFSSQPHVKCRLENIVFSGTDEITYIGRQAFAYCESLKSPLSFPNLPVIIEESFKSCRKVPSYVFGDALTRIEKNAFHFSNGIREFHAGANVEFIGDGAFECQGHIPSQLRVFNLSNADKVTYIGSSAFRYNDYLSTPLKFTNITTLYTNTFERCGRIPSIEFGDALVEIKARGMALARGLKKVTFGANLRSIGASAFEGQAHKPCGMSELKFGDVHKLEYIGNIAFRYCKSLPTVYVSKNCTVESNAFEGSKGGWAYLDE